MPRFQVRIEDDNRVLRPFTIALDPKGVPMYTSHLLEPVHISVYSQSEEARYANLLPGVGSVYAQDDLSGGLGKKVEVHKEDPQFDRYYYMEWMDGSVRGHVQKGCAVTTLTAPANSGALSGFFVLGGVPYLVLGRRIASWASDALTAVHDYGAGKAGALAAVFTKLGAEAAGELNATQTGTFYAKSPDDRLAQSFRVQAPGTAFLGAIKVLIQRTGLGTPATPVITTAGTAGVVTWTYKVSALNGSGETPVSAAGSTALGNATLSATNYNIITWGTVPGATGYKIYRTVAGTSPASIGFIGVALGSSISFNDTGYAGDTSTPNTTDTSGQMSGDVRLSIMSDLNGRPSMQIITSSSMSAMQVPMAGTTMTFRFDDDATMALPFNVPLWMVLDCVGASPNVTLGWFSSVAVDPYALGIGSSSTDRGNKWTATGGDFVFEVDAKSATSTAFIGSAGTSPFFKTSSDGATFTADTYRLGKCFATVANVLVRTIADANLNTDIGSIETSTDGANWNGDPIVVGDPIVPITNLVPLGEALIVCKEDGIYAVDLSVKPVDVQQVYPTARAATNGAGACFWRGAVYVPLNGRLAAVEGDFSSGFTVHESVGIEALQEWDWPWGQGRHVACVGTRFHLYSAVSTTGGYRLLKSGNPLRKKADGVPDPEWHGSVATIGDGSQSVTMLAHYDPGGASSPQLFVTTTSNNIARVQLPRSFNPASDANYSYDISTPGDLYFPYANGNYPVHPKAWLTESTTFQKATAGDYTESQYDDLSGEGWRRIPSGGRLYNTGALPYPRGLASQLLARRLRLVNSAVTASPLLHAFGVAYAMRHVKGAAMREITFTVVAEDGLSAADMGEMLGIDALGQRGLLASAAGGGGGTRRMEDPYGRRYERVQFLDAVEALQQVGQTSGGRTLIQVSAVAVAVSR